MSTSPRRRSAARLAAVQTLYAAALSDARIEDVLRDVLEGRLGGETLADIPDPDGVLEPRETVVPLAPADTWLLSQIVRATWANRARLDESIEACLTGDWSGARMEALVRAILRAAVGELTEVAGPEGIPPRVTITEYVDLAGAFYDGAEVKLVNAVLDRIARELNPDAFAAR